MERQKVAAQGPKSYMTPRIPHTRTPRFLQILACFGLLQNLPAHLLHGLHQYLFRLPSLRPPVAKTSHQNARKNSPLPMNVICHTLLVECRVLYTGPRTDGFLLSYNALGCTALLLFTRIDDSASDVKRSRREVRCLSVCGLRFMPDLHRPISSDPRRGLNVFRRSCRSSANFLRY